MSAPLPFMGQKRMFAKEFVKVLGQFRDKAVFVDLFGGSGLLSHIAKCQRPTPRSYIMISTVTTGACRPFRRRMPSWPICAR